MGPTETLDSQLEGNWLAESAREAFGSACARYALRAQKVSADGGGVLVVEQDPLDYAAAVLTALLRGIPVFLGNPRWGRAEWEQLENGPLSLRVWGGERSGEVLASFPGAPGPGPWKGYIMIPTGGTGGRLRFAMHTMKTLYAAARGLQSYLGGRALSSLCCLPLFHVSGWMQLVRAWSSGGRVCFADISSLAQIGWPAAAELGVEQISLVPTQVYRLLGGSASTRWLESFQYVWVGGGPMGESLREHLGRTGVRAYPCYGMTETAAMVAVCEPEIWREYPEVPACSLPHAKCLVNNGEILVRSLSLFHGYFPNTPVVQETFSTGDEGCSAGNNGFRVLGRRDRFIISGGEKVDPLEVEKGIRRTGMVDDVLIHSCPDPEWGQSVVAWIKLRPGQDLESLRFRLAGEVAPPLRPRKWHVTDDMPRLENGKPDWHRITQG